MGNVVSILGGAVRSSDQDRVKVNASEFVDACLREPSEIVLDRSLKAEGKFGKFKQIWELNPLTRTSAIALIDFFGSELRDADGEPLAVSCILKAVYEYEKRTLNRTEQTALAAYYFALLDAAERVSSIDILRRSKPRAQWVRWEPFSCPVIDFARGAGSGELLFVRSPINVDLDAVSGRLLLSSKILSLRETNIWLPRLKAAIVQALLQV